MKTYLLAAALLFCLCAYAQNKQPKLEVYVAPGFFLEQLNTDTLIPKERRNTDRIGDVTSYAVQVAAPLKNQRWALKGGIGFSQRHYSINKYSLDDFFISLFLFDSQFQRDTSNISYVRFTNNYFQVPLSVAYTLTRPAHNFQVTAGLNIRADFLTSQKADVRFDLTYQTPNQTDIVAAHKAYTENASKFVLTAEPYFEGSFSVYKNFGLLFQLRPFSFYSTSLDKRFTGSTVEVFSSTFGATYSFK